MNEAAFAAAVDDIARVSARFLASLESTAAPKNREEEAAKARARAAQRYGPVSSALHSTQGRTNNEDQAKTIGGVSPGPGLGAWGSRRLPQRRRV